MEERRRAEAEERSQRANEKAFHDLIAGSAAMGCRRG